MAMLKAKAKALNEYTIYHNPRCKKSREALAYLENRGIAPNIELYLQNPPVKEDLKKLLAKLDLEIGNIIRTEEPEFKAHFRGKNFTNDEWLTILVENPKFIQRPIVVCNNRAVVGRSTHNLEKLFQ